MEAMCEACQRKDVRLLQDRFNFMFITMKRVAEELECDDDDGEKAVKNLDKWVRTRVRDRTNAILKAQSRKHDSRSKEVKHTKYENGVNND